MIFQTSFCSRRLLCLLINRLCMSKPTLSQILIVIIFSFLRRKNHLFVDVPRNSGIYETKLKAIVWSCMHVRVLKKSSKTPIIYDSLWRNIIIYSSGKNILLGNWFSGKYLHLDYSKPKKSWKASIHGRKFISHFLCLNILSSLFIFYLIILWQFHTCMHWFY